MPRSNIPRGTSLGLDGMERGQLTSSPVAISPGSENNLDSGNFNSAQNRLYTLGNWYSQFAVIVELPTDECYYCRGPTYWLQLIGW